MIKVIRYAIIASSASILLVSGALASAQGQPRGEAYPNWHAQNSRVAPPARTDLRFAPRRAAPIYMAAVSISPSQAKSIALRSVPGSEFLDIKLVGGNTYIVRVIKSGRRIDVRVDAQTGQIKR